MERVNSAKVYKLGKFGRWAFAEFKSVYEIESDFNKLMEEFIAGQAA